MKYALISSTENALNPNTQEVLGWRVAEIVDQPFEVYQTLFFVECSDQVVANEWYYDQADQQIKEIPLYVLPEPINQPVTSGTQSL